MQLFKTPPASHTSRILKQLKKAGHYGSWNHELAQQSIGGLDWRKCISNLRKQGYNIQAVRISKGTFKYYLNEETS